MMASNLENTKSILIVYEEDAEEWALYLKSIFSHIIFEDHILLYNLEAASIHDLELQSLRSYQCKVLILSSEVLKYLNLNKRRFLDKVLQPPEQVVIFLCGIENSAIVYQILNIDPNNQLITTDQDPEEYLAVITAIIQQGPHDPRSLGLKCSRELNEDVRETTERILETQEKPEVLVLPKRISCQNPGEIFILLQDDVPCDSVVVEFVTANKRVRTEPDVWNQKVRWMKALDFPSGFVNVNVYCEGVIKATTQIEYYTMVEEMESLLQKVADPIAFTCQASNFSSTDKIDSILTFLLDIPVISHNFSHIPNKVLDHHCQRDLQVKELPTLLHCAAKFGLKKLASLLLQCPEAAWACNIINKYGENPGHLAEKYGHKEIQKIIKEFSTNEDSNEIDGEEEGQVNTEDDNYVMMMSSESHCRPSLREKPEVSKKTPKKGDMDGETELKDKERERVVVKDTDGAEGDHTLLADPHCLDGSSEHLYDDIIEETFGASDRNVSYAESPPLPPRTKPAIPKQQQLLYMSPAWETVTDEEVTKIIRGDQKEDNSEEVEEEDPYLSAEFRDGVYDIILGNAIKERRGGKSFIMNRPPAPAPRSFMPVKEESTPYIAQDRVYGDRTTYTTIKLDIPPGQEELILLQEQVKKGIISMDEAVEKFKQWQSLRSGLVATKQEKICQLRDSIIRERPEEESTLDNITIVHHPGGSVNRGKDSLNAEGVVYSRPFGKQHNMYLFFISFLSRSTHWSDWMAELVKGLQNLQ
uniref:B-cell scaffold protein with ankyrin repeats isoform X3 n=1 Tax=Pogona vitticeps TaxID=103695 RepID=A0ABM5GJX9_9SAUR